MVKKRYDLEPPEDKIIDLEKLSKKSIEKSEQPKPVDFIDNDKRSLEEFIKDNIEKEKEDTTLHLPKHDLQEIMKYKSPNKTMWQSIQEYSLIKFTPKLINKAIWGVAAAIKNDDLEIKEHMTDEELLNELPINIDSDIEYTYNSLTWENHHLHRLAELYYSIYKEIIYIAIKSHESEKIKVLENRLKKVEADASRRILEDTGSLKWQLQEEKRHLNDAKNEITDLKNEIINMKANHKRIIQENYRELIKERDDLKEQLKRGTTPEITTLKHTLESYKKINMEITKEKNDLRQQLQDLKNTLDKKKLFQLYHWTFFKINNFKK